VTVAWGLTRTKALSAFFDGSSLEKRTLLGLIFGVLASSEVIFPGDRAPYVSHTLLVCLAQFVGGADVALPAILTVFVVGMALRGPSEAIQTLVVLSFVGLVVEIIRRWWRKRPTILIVSLTGALTQTLALVLRNVLLPLTGSVQLVPYHLASVFANAFGLFLIMVVWKDAQTRATSEQNRLDVEHVRTLLLAADLNALRARIRPHFLFNAFTAIAALCDIDPKKAQSSILKMGQLMRRHIEVDSASLIGLDKELDYVRTYVEIQQLRFGKKASVIYDLEQDSMTAKIPAFSLQTLVENAFQHGIERRTGPGTVTISIRRSRHRIVLAVRDDGAGMDESQRKSCIGKDDPPTHGLTIADRQLRTVFGDTGRMRLFSRINHGTVAAFQIPVPDDSVNEGAQ